MEYQYLVTELNANEKIKNVLNYEIASLSAIIQQKRRFIAEIEEHDIQIQERIKGISVKDRTLVTFDSK